MLTAYKKLSLKYSETHTFTADDIRYLHKIFMMKVYKWAGDYRKVDISSVDIRWCHAAHIGSEMQRLNGLLTTLTPFTPELERAEVLERLAKIHGELVVIHPFRDGNGRITRLFCDLLLMQAEINPIGQIQMNRDAYFTAIRSIWAKKDYAPLIRLFDSLLVK